MALCCVFKWRVTPDKGFSISCITPWKSNLGSSLGTSFQWPDGLSDCSVISWIRRFIWRKTLPRNRKTHGPSDSRETYSKRCCFAGLEKRLVHWARTTKFLTYNLNLHIRNQACRGSSYITGSVRIHYGAIGQFTTYLKVFSGLARSKERTSESYCMFPQITEETSFSTCSTRKTLTISSP